MKERPILFSTDMVKAILNGSKTQTRRVVKEKYWKDTDGNIATHICRDGKDGFISWFLGQEYDKLAVEAETKKAYANGGGFKCPYGEVGDRLYVKETFREDTDGFSNWIDYKADNPVGNIVGYKYKWKPSLFMPKKYARIQLEITDVRIERLHDISEEDAIAEGVKVSDTIYIHRQGSHHNLYKNYIKSNRQCQTATESYFSLWEKINGKESLDSNPFVWVVEFKRIA